VKEPGSRLTARQALDHPWITACRDELNKQAGREPDSPATAIMRNPQMLREIQAFSSLNGMHKVALELLAFGAPSAEVDRLRALFNAIDTDGSGAISRDEFASAMKGHPQLKESEVLHLFEQLDFSKQGEVSYNEFLAATLGMAAGPIDEDRVRVVFERLDTDGDGIVTRDDLLGALGTATSRSDIDNWFEQMGVNSGKIFFHDMLRLMTERRDKTKAGVHATSGGSIGSGPAGKHPSLAQLGRALSASNVTLQTDAKVAERRQTELAPKGLSGRWLSRGRTVQNLNKLIASAQGSAGVPSASGTASAASGPPSPAAPGSTHKRRAIDGGPMIATS
jgi:Ca2+-binding EF-hand superfamily protein